MLVAFGISWPISIFKSWKAKSAKGKSVVFLGFILFGYACGIAAKLISGNVTYVLFFYSLNVVLVLADMCLYFRNRKLDKAGGENA